MMNFLKNFTVRKRQLEFIPALFETLWGLWIVNPFWISFNASPVYKVMDKIAPEPFWGIGFLAIGLFQLIFLFTDKMKVRLVAALISSFALVTMSILFIFSSYESAASITHIVIALCAWFGYTEVLATINKKEGR